MSEPISNEFARSSLEYDLRASLNWARLEVRRINEQNGWFDSDRTFGDDIALAHSELSEALEAFRTWGINDATQPIEQKCWSNGKHNPRICKHGLLPGKCTIKLPKPEGVGSELADVLVRLLDTCERHEIDLGVEFIRKLKYNETRSYRHGNKGL